MRRATICALFGISVFLGSGSAGAAQNQNSVSAPEGGTASASGSYLAGWYAQRVEEWEAAARFIHRALEQDPDERRLLHRAFLLRVAEGRIPDSLPLAEQIQEGPDPSTLALLVLMLDRLDRDDKPGARALVQTIPEGGIGRFIQPLLSAWFLSDAGEPSAAVNALAALGDSSGFGVLKDLHAGEILSLAGRSKEAEAAFENALHASGQSLRILLAATRFLVNTGKIAEAAAVLQQVEDTYPTDISVQNMIDALSAGRQPPVMQPRTLREGIAEALFDIASAFIQERSELVALIYLRASLHAHPEFPLARMQLAGLLADSGQYETAISVYRGVLSDPILRYSAGLYLADTLHRIDRSDEALAILQELAEAYPHRLNPVFRIANLHRQADDWPAAVAAYSEALSRPPAQDVDLRWRLLYGRAIAFDQMKDWEGAETDLLAALDVAPDQPDVLNYLGYTWADKGIHLERAKDMITRAVGLRPRNGYIVDSLGWVEFRLGNLDVAVRELERAIELQPADPTINDHLGDVYWAVGRRLEALYQWRRTLRFVGEDDGELARSVEDKLQEHDWKAEGGLRRAGTATRQGS